MEDINFQVKRIAEKAVSENKLGSLQEIINSEIKEKGQDEMALLTKNINQMVEQLRRNIEKEREIKRQKNELITNVSHDLRTPLTSIMGYLRLLRDEKYDCREQYHEYIKIAFSKSEQLKNLIEDLFEYTKLTNEKIVLEKQTVCMNEMLD